MGQPITPRRVPAADDLGVQRPFREAQGQTIAGRGVAGPQERAPGALVKRDGVAAAQDPEGRERMETRGELAEERALVLGRREGSASQALLDLDQPEPLRADSPLHGPLDPPRRLDEQRLGAEQAGPRLALPEAGAEELERSSLLSQHLPHGALEPHAERF